MIIEPKHFEYLVIQHGNVAHEQKNFVKWKAAYEASLQTLYEQIKSSLPKTCCNLLDIGSGLGGIDILLRQHYGDSLETMWLLDGLNDPPEVKSSFKTFNNAKVTLDFQAKNGVTNARVITDTKPVGVVDLVVSFSAYGFHIHPGDYLQDIKEVIHKDTVILLDVRRTKRVWLELFVGEFGVPKVLHQAEKYVRLGFRV